eukprot:gene20407-biopygen5579
MRIFWSSVLRISRYAPQRLFGAFLGSKAARNGLKCAPQRRVYPRSLAKCPIDGTH